MHGYCINDYLCVTLLLKRCVSTKPCSLKISTLLVKISALLDENSGSLV